MQKIDLNGKTILVTGGAGFIGSNLIKRLFKDTVGTTIVNIDNMNDYYDVSLKEYRLAQLKDKSEELKVNYQFVKGDIADKALVDKLFADYRFDVVVNLAAQAGVRYSIENPDAYIMSNMMGFYHILEACRHNPVEHLVYASSSSVYGGNKKVPFSTDDRVDNPVSLYAATKKSNELFAHCYSKLYNIPTTGLRFFTVYGPAGRPDMAYFGFTNKLLVGKTIQIFNYGNCRRDFTYVDDIVEGIVRVMQGAPSRQTGDDAPSWQSMQGIGYSEFMDVMFDPVYGDLLKTIDELTSEDIESIREKIVMDSVHYAKRQMTFFRSFADVKWIDADDMAGLKGTIDSFVN